ncbi:MAG: glycosyltransferase family 2 protein, partial [Alphaproteobacteria bacterium]|nr:glycosyltransferase family 2 protein [Alphaproteobacteria bacterium]
MKAERSNENCAPRIDRKPTLSAVVVAHNEEAQLAACLATLAFADEIVVLLDRCIDHSHEIASRFADRILEGEWAREAARRTAAVAACTGDWIFETDADERVSPALAAEIRSVVTHSAASWHLVPVDNYIGDRLVRWGWGAFFGRSAHAALYRRDVKSWRDDRVLHASVALSGPQGPNLEERLAHYVDRNISDMLLRLDRYTSLHAQDLRESGDIGSFAHNLRRIASRFWKCYVGRRGYREGPYGFLIALCAALYPILSYLKARLEPGEAASSTTLATAAPASANEADPRRNQTTTLASRQSERVAE